MGAQCCVLCDWGGVWGWGYVHGHQKGACMLLVYVVCRLQKRACVLVHVPNMFRYVACSVHNLAAVFAVLQAR